MANVEKYYESSLRLDPFPESKSSDEDLQNLQSSKPDEGWTSILKADGVLAATFFLLTEFDFPECGGTPHPEGHDRIKPPQVNVDAAATFLCSFLRRSMPDGQFALAGNTAMRIHDAQRQTFGVTAWVKPEGKTKGKTKGRTTSLLREMLQESRFILPSIPLYRHGLECYLKTGPSFGDDVKIDRIVPINLVMGWVPFLDDHILTTTTNEGQEIQVLKISYLLNSKIQALLHHGKPDDYDDILYLVSRFSHGIRKHKRMLDQVYVRHFLADVVASRESKDTYKFFKKVLMVSWGVTAKPVEQRIMPSL